MNLGDLCRHEGGHAAAALLIGVPVKRVGLDREGGLVAYHPHSHTRDGALLRTIVILAGQLETGVGLPGWPPRAFTARTQDEGDVRLLSRLAIEYGLTGDEYNGLVSKALALTRRSDYCALRDAIAHELSRTGEVGERRLAQLKAIYA